MPFYAMEFNGFAQYDCIGGKSNLTLSKKLGIYLKFFIFSEGNRIIFKRKKWEIDFKS